MSVHIPSHLQDAEAELLTAWKRIAELEAERDQAERERFRFGALNKGLSNRIAELEAEVARLKNDEDRVLAIYKDKRLRDAEAERDIWRRDADEQMALRLKAEGERDAAVQRDTVNAALTRAAINKSEGRIAELEAALSEIANSGARQHDFAIPADHVTWTIHRARAALSGEGVTK